jgi:putative transcriptional regulator
MNRVNLIREIRETLSNSGFYVSELYPLRPIGFDLIARRDNSLLIIKVLINIDGISEHVARELKVLSNLLRASPLLIGVRSSTGLMEYDVVYDRFGIQALNVETLKNHLLDGLPLKIFAGPGGLYVRLNRDKLVKLRKKHNVSIGSFARSIRVSRRTVRLYEEGMNARVEIASRIEELLGDTVTSSIDILNTRFLDEHKKDNFKNENPSHRDFQNEIFSILRKLGYEIIPMERCPFEAVSKDKDEILLTCVNEYNEKLIRKAHVVSSISKITEKHAVLFTDKEINKKNIEGTPIIIKKELRNISGPEDIIELIMERICY